MSGEALSLPDVSLDSAASAPAGPIALGTDGHKNLFCRTLLSTFDPYRPTIIDWPKLDDETLARLKSLPIWDIAVQTEGRAGTNVGAFAETVTDPFLKQAVELNAFEERRHKRVLHNMVQSYDIALAPEPPYVAPRQTEWAFMVTGYSECIDSFFAFGLFETAKRTGFFPPPLVETFETVMREEGRHILFFVNWVAWHRRNLPLWKRPWFALKIACVWMFLGWERMGMVRDVSGAPVDNNFTVTGTADLGIDISIAELMDTCLAENDRRLGVYDERLLRPNFVPRMVRFARRFMPARKATA